MPEIFARSFARKFRPLRLVGLPSSATGEWYDSDIDAYRLPKAGKVLSRKDLVDMWVDFAEKYPIISLEDGMDQTDMKGWKMLTEALGDRIQLVGDDLFVTNTKLFQKGIDLGIANSILIKPNQIGTLTETLLAVRMAKEAGYTAIISHRSGETEDTTIAFVDGNHENFPKIYAYPCEHWNGGKIHKIRHNIFHLMRGQIYTIEGNTFFVMGGAYSIDKYRRTEGVSWWQQELPNKEEYNEAIQNLEKENMSVDYILTHTAPTEIIRKMGHAPDLHDRELCGFLEWIMYEAHFKKWYFGHWHTDKDIDSRFSSLWFETKKITPHQPIKKRFPTK